MAEKRREILWFVCLLRMSSFRFPRFLTMPEGQEVKKTHAAFSFFLSK